MIAKLYDIFVTTVCQIEAGLRGAGDYCVNILKR